MSAVTQAQLSSALLDQLQNRRMSRHPTGRLIYYDDCSSTKGWFNVAGSLSNKAFLETDSLLIDQNGTEPFPSSACPNGQQCFRIWTPQVSTNTAMEIVHRFPTVGTTPPSTRYGMEFYLAIPMGSNATPATQVNSFEFGMEYRDGTSQYYTDIQYNPVNYNWTILNSSLAIVSTITNRQLYVNPDLRWYNIKATFDFNSVAPKYGKLWIQDVAPFDLSAIPIQKIANTDPSYFYAWFQLRDGTVPGEGFYYISDIFLTEEEP